MTLTDAGRVTVDNQSGCSACLAVRGGTRRERGAALGAYARKHGLTLVHRTYSETYGFQTATYAIYDKPQEDTP